MQDAIERSVLCAFTGFWERFVSVKGDADEGGPSVGVKPNSADGTDGLGIQPSLSTSSGTASGAASAVPRLSELDSDSDSQKITC
jgi:hypothetical protein